MPEGMLLLSSVARTHDCLVRDLAKREDDTTIRHLIDFLCKVGIAVIDFIGHRLVLRRYAAHGIGDPAIDQLQTVIEGNTLALVGKAVLMERFVKQESGMVTGEGAPGGIGAMQTRSQPDDKETRIRRTE
jgi:hypothetical protein